ncbi:hypothetical protein J6P59_01505 [bacterium]|nr:hypothetical protein [bacterium]MBO6072328.1 hypothetical protein [bacterium]
MNINFLTFSKKDKAPVIDENKVNKFLLKENINPQSKYFTLYNGTILLLNEKFANVIQNENALNTSLFKGKETSRVVSKVLKL